MQTKSFKTEEVNKNWWLVDANGKNLGRLASELAKVITGKNKPQYTPNADLGDFVIVINADKVAVTGNKDLEKKYYRHSLHFGGLREFSAAEMRNREPTKMIEQAVEGMLPKNKLANRLIKHLKAYAGSEHPHKAQNPQALNI